MKKTPLARDHVVSIGTLPNVSSTKLNRFVKQETSACSRCNMIFMIPVKSSFHSDSHRFVSFNNTSVFCLVFSNSAASLSAT